MTGRGAIRVEQTNISFISFNCTQSPLRGLHRQMPLYAEIKLVRCTCGGIVDVAVDVCPESRTAFKRWSTRRKPSTGQRSLRRRGSGPSGGTTQNPASRGRCRSSEKDANWPPFVQLPTKELRALGSAVDYVLHAKPDPGKKRTNA